MEWRIELILVPVTDVDRAQEFPAGKVGFTVDPAATPGLTADGSGRR